MSYLKHLDLGVICVIGFMLSIVITHALMRIIAFVKKDAALKNTAKVKSFISKNADTMNDLNTYLVLVYDSLEEFVLGGEYIELVTDEKLQPGTTYVNGASMFTVVTTVN